MYGGGSAQNHPTGLINVPGVPQNVAMNASDLHGSFCAVEKQIEAADVSLDSCGVIVSPATRKILRPTPSFPGGGQSSPEVTMQKRSPVAAAVPVDKFPAGVSTRRVVAATL